MNNDTAQRPLRKPDWLRVKLGHGPQHQEMLRLLTSKRLHTVCQEALCPNQGECWSRGHATLMLLGDTCSRNCRFCNVSDRRPLPPDSGEPERAAQAVAELKLRHIVLTSVTRDDLPDGGAAHWAATISKIKAAAPTTTVEILVPDFMGEHAALDTVINAGAHVFGHNLETVPRLYPAARPQADYRRSLDVLAYAAAAGCITKTGLMLGMGEEEHEIDAVMQDARAAGTAILYLGQYLQPSPRHLPVARYVKPEEFDRLRRKALAAGFPVAAAAPLLRSSYPSEEQDQFVGNT